MPESADVIIVGAGVSGCSIAYHLGTLGIRDVILVEKLAAAGQGSTSKANGGIRAQWSTAVNIRLSNYSIAAFERFTEETGGDCGLVQAGYLFLTASDKGERTLRKNLGLQQQLGVPNRWLTPSEIGDFAPFARCDDLRGGTFSPKDGFIDPHGSTLGYLRAAQRMGARLATEAEVLEVTRDSRGVTGVRTPAGHIHSRIVVNAAGPHAGMLAERAGTDIPVRPFKRMLACTEAIGGAPTIIPMIVDLDQGLLIRREGKGIILAHSNPEDPPTFDTSFDPSFIEIVSEKALLRFPFLEHARISPRRCWAGLYPETPTTMRFWAAIPALPASTWLPASAVTASCTRLPPGAPWPR